MFIRDHTAALARAATRNLLNRSCAIGALTLGAIALPQAAYAQDECGAATGASVTCTSAGNNYPNGITYIAPPQDLTINVDPDVVIDTSGTLNTGILAVADPVNAITINADSGASITTGDIGAFGILAGTTAGDATVNASNIVTSGDAATGVLLLTDTGTATANIGTVYTDGAGANGVSVYTGTGAINASGFTVVTNGAGSAGFNLDSQNGDVNLTLARGIFGGTVLTYGDGSAGIIANAGGDGDVSITGNGPGGFGSPAVVTSGAASAGVLANAQDGDVLVDLAQVQTTGLGSDAIVATSLTGGVTVNASTVTADDGRGIVATGATFATVTQSGNFIGTGGDNHAAVTVLATNGPASATLGTAFTNGANSNAVDVRSLTGTANASVGGVTTQGAGSTGVFVLGTTGATAASGSVRTYGDNAVGVNVASTGGPVSVTNNGDVRTTGLNSAAILATGTGNVAIGGTGSVTTAGANAAGVQALSTGGPVSVTTAAVSTSGANAVAINAIGTSASVTANGIVTRSGAAGAGPLAAINVQGTTGAASANVGTVTASGVGLSGVSVNGATTASATIRAGGIVNGSLDALNITSVTGSTVTNAGTLNSGTGYAIRATGGAAAITNSGTINGRVLLTGGNDTIANSGTFNANLASDFGAGDDVFTNTGTYTSAAVTDLGAGNDSFVNSGTFTANAGGGLNFNIGADSFTNSGTLRVLPGTAAAGTISFTGLESFGNSGTIDLRNGHTGDVLSLGTAAFTGSGNSTLALDVQLGGATITADRLVTGAATGSTRVLLGDLTTGTPSLNPGVLLVQAGAGSNAGAFTLAGGQVTNGFANYSIAYNATDFGYRLVAAPSSSAFRTLSLTEGMRSLWYTSADAWSGHMTSLRDATWRAPAGSAPVGTGLWMTMYGESNTRRNAQDFSTFGVNNSTEIGYKQDAFGGQIGFDFGSAGPDGGLVFGITGGYLNSTQGFAGSSDRINYDVANVGGYLSYVSGSFFANALAKYDRFWVGSHLAGVDNSRDLKGQSYGAQGEIGIRFGGDSFFAEPVASIAYVRTSLDDLDVPGFSFDFDAQEGLRGKAGLRIGSGFDIAGSRALVYASGMAVHEFEGRDNVGIVSGGQTVVLRGDRIGTYGQGTLGFSATTLGGVTGFIEGFGNYSSDYRGGGARAGLRVSF